MVAKTKGLNDIQDFDQPATNWPSPPEWRQEVLDELKKVQEEEDQRIAEEASGRREREITAERERKAADRAHRVAEEQVERERRAAEAVAAEQQRIQGAGPSGTGTFSCF